MHRDPRVPRLTGRLQRSWTTTRQARPADPRPESVTSTTSLLGLRPSRIPSAPTRSSCPLAPGRFPPMRIATGDGFRSAAARGCERVPGRSWLTHPTRSGADRSSSPRLRAQMRRTSVARNARSESMPSTRRHSLAAGGASLARAPVRLLVSRPNSGPAGSWVHVPGNGSGSAAPESWGGSSSTAPSARQGPRSAWVSSSRFTSHSGCGAPDGGMPDV